MSNKVNMKELFLEMQQEMLMKLKLIRNHVTHAPTKGNAVELSWIEFLGTYLPNRYCVDTAFIVDHTGTRSDQIDLVIYDQQYSPFVFCHAGVKYIPAESVYAIFEVKQTLNKQHIEYAAKKAESVRLLNRTSVNIVHAGGVYPARPIFDIVAGIITTSSDWNPAFGKSFQEIIELLEPKQRLNIGCALDSGSFLLQPDGTIDISSNEESLIFFFIKLFTQLQNLGTVPAMNIDLYSQALDSI
ncbi:DUF6602 domain-containing protein [Paenibacillus sp. Soil787]|uniref:DUF6602 domain-containing protein n=1 Tax=Paenibacillus sp. Soil787 TaxID=1736411 RepID=UPI0006F51FBE|nr:DUF6602 domain-containing protein [Paenibacillus sp. Soil787]KRF31943.1 hypothetical protein ASG93_06380 [Paenibacillus sp. Soil787]